MMYDREQPESDKSRNLDDLLRKSAPGAQPPHEFRRNLKLILLSKCGPDRSQWLSINRLVVVAIVFLFAFLMSGNNVGSGDFRLKRQGPAYESIYGTMRYGGEEKPQDSYEQMYQHQAAKEEVLRSVCGWTVMGETFLSAEYEYDLNGELHTMSRTIQTPISLTPTRKHLQFLHTFEAEFLRLHDNGQTFPAGTEEIQLDNLSIPLTKWKATFPDYGEVIYWEARTIP
jgi:hypothetical protein